MNAAEVTGWARPPTSMVRNGRRGMIGLAVVALAVTAVVRAAPDPADLSAIAARATAPPASAAAGQSEQNALEAYGKLPLAFVPNSGQTEAPVRFSARAVGASFYFTQTEAILSFAKAADHRRIVLGLAFLGANPETRLEGRGLLPGKVNYLIGSDPKKWHTNISSYGQVVYRDLWPGIDMVFRGDANRLKYEFVLRPGARVKDIRLAYRGADRLALGAGGQLLIATGAGTLTDARPVSYQEVRGRRVPVKSRFLLEPAAGQTTAYGFGVGAYDPRRPLVIDPGLLYSTYLGGASTDVGNPIAVDAAGNAYVTGETSSNNFPTTVGAFDTTYNGNIDAFVTKLNATGTALIYSTYLGGAAGSDRGFGITVDGAGNAFITGETASSNFPTTLGAFDTSFNLNTDAFVTKLNAAGSGLVYSTYLGAGSNERGAGIAVDGAGSAYVAGRTNSSAFPTTLAAFDTTYNGSDDAFVTKLNPGGSAPLAYSTFLGGAGDDRGFGVAVDSAGSSYVTGETNSGSFPTTAGAFDTTQNGGFDFFVTKLSAAGSAPLAYSTFLGGGSDDRGRGIALDGAGSAYVTGLALGGFPTTPGAFDTSHNGGDDAVATKLNAAGSGLAYSTFLGGSGTDRGFSIAVDNVGSAHVTGETNSTGFPTTPGAFDTTNNNADAFVTQLNQAGAALVYSTFLGGSNDEQGFGIAVDAGGNAYVTGQTQSNNFPTTVGAFDTTYNTNGDAFVTKLDLIGAPMALTLTPAADTNPVGTSHTVTATVTDFGGNRVPGVTVRFSVTGANPASGSATTDANGQATFTYTGNNAGSDAIHAFADTNNSGTQNPGEPFGDATKTWTAPVPATLTLDPAADTNPVGTSHTVTATVRDAAGNPVANVIVRFTVSGSVSTSGQCTTTAAGQCNFTYSGPTTPGADTISAFADSDDDGVQDVGEPVAAAQKTWTPAAPATLLLTPAADTNPVGTDHTVTATVRDAFGNPTPNVIVRFTVSGSVSTSGQCTTTAAGQCNFTYSGPTTPGADTISAFADSDDDGVQDVGEPVGKATKTWTPGPPATLTLEPETAENQVGDPHTVTATVEDRFGNPTPGVLVRFSVTGANTTSGSAVTDANGEAPFTYTGTTTGTDTITAFADTDADGTQDEGEPGDTASKTWTAGPPATLVLDPAAATNTVGATHCVTATVTDAFGNPVPGVTVRFSVPTAVATFATPASGSGVTDPNGEATFCFSASLPGVDAIHAFADTDTSGTQEAGEPFGDATKMWTPPPSTELCEVKITQGGWIVAKNGDRASFGGNARVSHDGSSVEGQQEYQDHGPAQPRNVHSIELVATTCSDDLTSASIFGTATIDGSGEFVFRIDVTDVGEPGTNDSYGIMLSDGYASGQKQLGGGNVQIHK
jgi:Bacterial Ig-like domain (group 1)/Beta-propeller repeat